MMEGDFNNRSGPYAGPQPVTGVGATTVVYRRPDDVARSGLSWRDELANYNEAHGSTQANPLGLLPAWRLYQEPTYEYLVDRLGTGNVFILSAGWGLVSAAFLTPNYDITFTKKSGKLQAPPISRSICRLLHVAHGHVDADPLSRR